jgi:hypothetical protein
VLLAVLVGITIGLVPLLSPHIPHATVRRVSAVTERCLVPTRGADDDLWALYPDTMWLRTTVLPQLDSGARVLADASTGVRTDFWLPLDGDSVELRGHHAPTIRLSGGANPSGIAYRDRKLSVLAWMWARTAGGGVPVSARVVECPQHAAPAS